MLESSIRSEPDLIQRTALAALLHSFYTGVEGILLTVAKQVDQRVPTGPRWHGDLLDQAVAANDQRPAILTDVVRVSLDRYLAFRHFFRQAYSFVLSWDDMKDLVLDLERAWDQVRRAFETWLEKAGTSD